jgi:outer membrane protein OmpA-like peptidoglycan-associated protein
MKRFQQMFYTGLFLITLVGCANTYSNKDLLEIFRSRGLETSEKADGVVVFLPGVFFEFDKAELTAAAQAKLAEVATVLNDPRVIDREIRLEGHTDTAGSEEYNLNLSLKRAEAVQAILLASNVKSERMSTKGYGEKYPIAEDTNADGSPNQEGQAKNRRVEIIVKYKEKQSE